MDLMANLCVPWGGDQDAVWQQPFNAAALIMPLVLDSCFVLLGKLPRSSAGASSSSSSCMPAPFTRGRTTTTGATLVRSCLAGV
jgi:hypothetical protein